MDRGNSGGATLDAVDPALAADDAVRFGLRAQERGVAACVEMIGVADPRQR